MITLGRNRGLRVVAGLTALACWVAGPARAEELPADVVIRGGTLVDGSGSPRRTADVAIRGDRIVAVGDLAALARSRTIDAAGLVVAPGFIDLHTHSDDGIVAAKGRLNLNYITQGVTTIVTGNCGMGPIDVAKYFARIDAVGAGSNVVHLIPHGALRRAVLGVEDREPTAEEMAKLKELAKQAMDAGSWGMSTGLIYVPSRYGRTAELVELAKLVHGYGGIYASHIRNEERGLLEAVDEALAIGEQSGAPVHISHLKASGRRNWGKTAQALAKIAEARAKGRVATADQYPYVASSTSLGAMVVPHWAVRVSKEDFAKLADDPVQGPKLREEIQRELDERMGGAAIRLTTYAPKPSRVGKDLETIAKEEGTTPIEVVLDVQRHGGTQAINFSMSEDEVRAVMRSEFVATASDGSARGEIDDGARPHPRSFGTFPRKIRYAEDEHVLTLEQAVRANAGLPASILGLCDRGVVRPGAYADLVVFDPKTFRDAATFEEPMKYAEGARFVFVNGVAVVADGKRPDYPGPDDRLPGRALRLKKDGPADLVLLPGRIWTGDPARPWAEALAARAGAIVAVGSRDEGLAWKGPSTRLVEAPGTLATPGLVDAHGHIESLGASLLQLDLRGVKSLDEVARRVKEHAAGLPADAWVLGANWDQSLWPGGAFPDASVLDAAAPGRAVWLSRVDGHAGWASTEAMRRAGVDASSQPPSDGQIHHLADGRPSGVFIDGAMGLVGRVVPPPSREDVRKRILAAQDRILSYGLTGVHDAGVSAREAEVFGELDQGGALKLRVYAMASPPAGREVEFVSKPPRPATPGSRFEMRAIKLFIDGAMGSRGALLFEPYADDPHNVGLLLIDPKTLEATTAAAIENGWQVAVHAIGDKGNALVLDAFAAARRAFPLATEPRLRIEHAQVVRRQDVARFAELGVIASMQPSHASDDMRWADARLGPGRVDGAYAWRWFLDAKVRLAFGSDFPVEVVDPQWGLYAALTRQDAAGEPKGGWHPDQRMSLEETLRAFTAGAAYAAFAEMRSGVLKPGFRADVTVFDRDLFQQPPAGVLGAKVRHTIVDGGVAFEANRP
ncbi:amidohydrolase family protein [Paludisphaera mucosa]|uniref:Amidohydrolase family protein n=1 Tax=Paludisphaera mucosa TaxID=3030827 RepID=A0ABT6F3S9_9BACT|nr:amidohydrolase family protein [Paludisphaera mucosa]MDG3002191.1 amidohydrolase family protein [Paludisphaera mucosa]